MSVNKIPAERKHRFGRGFCQMAAFCTDSNSIEIGDIWLKVKVTVTQYPFFHHNSLLTSLLWISVFLCRMKVKYGMLLRYALYRFDFHFHEIRVEDRITDVI